VKRFSVIGLGRAGGSIATALGEVGWDLVESFGRSDDVSGAAQGCDVCIIATPDAEIANVSRSIRPGGATVVHLSGATAMSVLSHHDKRACLHPLVALPNPERGRVALRTAWFALAGVPDDTVVRDIAESLSGRWFPLVDDQRALYHATAVVASNHLVALMAQVERLAAELAVPTEPFLHLAEGALRDVQAHGAAHALTGPASRGDDATIEVHHSALANLETGVDEASLYNALSEAARRLTQDQQG